MMKISITVFAGTALFVLMACGACGQQKASDWDAGPGSSGTGGGSGSGGSGGSSSSGGTGGYGVPEGGLFGGWDATMPMQDAGSGSSSGGTMVPLTPALGSTVSSDCTGCTF